MANLDQKPIVSIACMTYNHALYIRDALDGFVMQKTTFPFEIVIHDDASTDGTTDIIREYQRKYPHLIRAVIQVENQYQKGVKPFFSMTFPQLRSTKYIALCEGDDYWIDPYKLQKQYEALENNPDCSLCFHPAKVEKNKKVLDKIFRFSESNSKCTSQSIYQLMNANYSTTASLFIKREFINIPPKWIYTTPVGDLPLKLIYLFHGNWYYINDVMSVYRQNSLESWSSRVTSDTLLKIKYRHKKIYMYEHFNYYSKHTFNQYIKEQQSFQIIKLAQYLPITKRLFYFRIFFKRYFIHCRMMAQFKILMLMFLPKLEHFKLAKKLRSK